jgi:hypothetical protein
LPIAAHATPVAIADLDRELKYLLPAGRVPFVERWLAATCRPDPAHPRGDVWTVYFDTTDQRSLREKINSDYLKTKIRVRWYSPPGSAPAGDAFLEMKRRIGDRRDKVRLPLPGAAADLASRALDDPRWRELPQQLVRLGMPIGGIWAPALALVYRRTRLVEAASGSRVSCDTAIRLAPVEGGARAACRPEPLPVAVIEVKSASDELPVALRPLVRVGARLGSFSKYAAVWDHVHRRIA